MEFTFSPQLHYLVHEADGEYVAHCLDLDFVGSGTTKDEAVQELNDAVIGLVVYMLRHGAEASNIKQAPARYWVMFEDAKANGTEIKTLDIPEVAAPVMVEQCHFTYCMVMATAA